MTAKAQHQTSAFVPRLLALLLAAPLLLLPVAVQAGSITFTLDFTFSGTTPSGTAPTAVLSDTGCGANCVQLVMNANLLPGAGTQFITEWDFNFSNLAGLTITNVGGQAAAGVVTGSNCCKADGDGFFDIEFDFATANNANRFTEGETSTYNFSKTGISLADFELTSAPGGGAGTFFSAAHVQGIPPNGSNSGFVGASSFCTENCLPPPLLTPVPSSLLLLGAGLVGMAGLSWRKRRGAK